MLGHKNKSRLDRVLDKDKKEKQDEIEENKEISVSQFITLFLTSILHTLDFIHPL